MLLLVLSGVAVADVALFGVHEHIADRDRGELSAEAHVAGLRATHHHCELSINPYEVAPAHDLAVPLAVAGAPPEPGSPALRDVSFVRLLPPRA